MWWKRTKTEQMPQIRKVMRLGVLLFHVGFLPDLFFSFAQLLVPSIIQPEHAGFHSANKALAYVIIFLAPVLMGLIFYHFYATYNSDVLEHYYTLREGAQYLQIYLQALILALSIGRPLLAACLIPLELLWLAFHYSLYRYGDGYRLLDCAKFLLSTAFIVLALLLLSLV